MTRKPTDEGYAPLTQEELDEITGEPLPERAALSLVNANPGVPVNPALTLTALNDDSIVSGVPDQDTPIDDIDRPRPPENG
jgi:hypothetical protein